MTNVQNLFFFFNFYLLYNIYSLIDVYKNCFFNIYYFEIIL